MSNNFNKDQLERFFGKIYMDLQRNAESTNHFSLKDYIGELYTKISEKSDDSLAIQYIQITPEYINLALSGKRALVKELRSKGLSRDEVDDLAEKFEDLSNVRRYLGIKNTSEIQSIDKFLRYTHCLSSILWSYSKEHLRVLRKKNFQQQIEFKMLSSSFYLSKLENSDYELFALEVDKTVNSLEVSVNDATYGEPLNAYSSFHMGKEYFIEKLDFYLEDIKKIMDDSTYFPKFIFHSIISMPLKNTDDFFFGSFNKTDYPEEFKTNLHKVFSLFEYFLNNSDEYIRQFNSVKNSIKFSPLDPLRNKQITERLLTLI